MSLREKALEVHENAKGKLEIKSKFDVKTREDLSILYTPGVAEPCKEIAANKEDVYKYTTKGNTVAVVTDGSAVLGLGNIGPEAALPVMEGKAILFKEFANIDALPICVDSQDVDDIVNTVKLISPSLGGINLEDIGAPRCFEVERRLKEELDIPVFHDDQHGTAIVVLGGLVNALKLINKKIEDIKIVVNGSGAAGTSITKLLLKAGAKNVIVCGRMGAFSSESEIPENRPHYKEFVEITNPNDEKGTLIDVMENADVFIGVSVANCVTKEMVAKMNKDAIVFAMANPTPEIMPSEAKEAGARIVGSGRSDFPNQINNLLAFPGILRGALDARASDITEEMKLAAAYAIASVIEESELTEDYIIPSPFNLEVPKKVAEAVMKVAKGE